MLTLAKILLILSLFIWLPFARPEEKNPGRNVTQYITEDLKTAGNQSIPLERRKNVTSVNDKRNTSKPMVTDASVLDLPTTYETIPSTSNRPTASSTEGPRPTPAYSIPPLTHSFVSKLPLNLSTANFSAHNDPTHFGSSENFTWSLDNDSMNVPDNISSTDSILPFPPMTTPVTPLTDEPTGWPATDNDNFAGFTLYQEKTTLQPTLKFTNNSKFFSNTSDSPKEYKNTGIVFGGILGAILGASLLSLVGYLLCGQRKTDSFSHRRLYDDRNEPVTTTQL
ncbi:mucin-15 isoform X1 [Arvicola amphibius]|uniref:mucin-15 isoform X1 n=1 Tax=Arvicola amphibius TaxID=1047088 RepID=UPI0018E3B946|nr:mucin-15 isoform X1 [Arvicola amphibius]